MTIDEVVAQLVEGNNRFVAGTVSHRDHPAQVATTLLGQLPFAIVHSCTDSRSAPEIIFDQGLGDIFASRIAGTYVQADILGSMGFAAKVAGAKLIFVVGHSACGAIMGAADNVQLGNLTTVIHSIQPAVEQVKNFSGERNSKHAAFGTAATELNVRMIVAKIRRDSPILQGLKSSDQLKIVGPVHGISTGKATILN